MNPELVPWIADAVIVALMLSVLTLAYLAARLVAWWQSDRREERSKPTARVAMTDAERISQLEQRLEDLNSRVRDLEHAALMRSLRKTERSLS